LEVHSTEAIVVPVIALLLIKAKVNAERYLYQSSSPSWNLYVALSKHQLIADMIYSGELSISQMAQTSGCKRRTNLVG
jgi:hypothetical protein